MMFKIKFTPDIKAAPRAYDPEARRLLDQTRLCVAPEEFYYNVVFDLGDDMISYHPAPAIIVLGDLLYELSQFRAGQNHEVHLSGYPLAHAVTDGGLVSFELEGTDTGKPVDRGDQTDPECAHLRICGEFDLKQVIDEFERAIDLLWSRITEIDKTLEDQGFVVNLDDGFFIDDVSSA